MLRDVKKDSRSTSLNQKNKKTTEFIQEIKNEVQRAKFHEELMQSKQQIHQSKRKGFNKTLPPIAPKINQTAAAINGNRVVGRTITFATGAIELEIPNISNEQQIITLSKPEEEMIALN